MEVGGEVQQLNKHHVPHAPALHPPLTPTLPSCLCQERLRREEALTLAELRRAVESLQHMDGSLKRQEQLVRAGGWMRMGKQERGIGAPKSRNPG